MWQCKGCAYYNDDWDDKCQKCGEDRNAEAAGTVQVVDAADADATIETTTPPGKEATSVTDQIDSPEPVREMAKQVAEPAAGPGSETGPGGSFTDRLLVAAIIIIAVGIIASAIAAWRLGLLNNDGQAQTAGGGTTQISTFTDNCTQLEINAEEIPAKYRKQAEEFVGDLSAARDARGTLRADPDRDGLLTDDEVARLEILDDRCDSLIDSYNRFEEFIARENDAEASTLGTILRSTYQSAFANTMDCLASFRSADLEGSYHAYLQSDALPAAVDRWGYLETDALREAWLSALHDRHQLKLDLEYADVYMQLEARISAVTEMHNAFNQELAAVAGYQIRSGVLGASAKEHLQKLDEFAGLIEQYYFEFSEYRESLADLEVSDKLDAYISSFEDLVQQDHLYCFSEIYVIYARDKELRDPVYENLKNHYAFVIENWPSLEMTYKGVAAKYENDWTRMWRPDVYAK